MRLTWYVTDKREYLASLAAIGPPYREVDGPALSGDDGGGGDGADRGPRKVEIEATAVVPDAVAG